MASVTGISSPAFAGEGDRRRRWRGSWAARSPSTMLRMVPLPRKSGGGPFSPPSSVVPQPLDGVDELANGLDLGLHVHRDEDVELVLDRGDEVHDDEAVPFEVPGEAGTLGQRDALLVEGLDQRGDLVEGLVSVGHPAPLWLRSFPAKQLGPKGGARLAAGRPRAMLAPRASQGERMADEQPFPANAVNVIR